MYPEGFPEGFLFKARAALLLAALMSLSLLVVTLALYATYYRVTDVRRLIGAR